MCLLAQLLGKLSDLQQSFLGEEATVMPQNFALLSKFVQEDPLATYKALMFNMRGTSRLT